MTNGDKIREMSNSELAEIIACPYDFGEVLCDEKMDCLTCCQEWLERECDIE